LSPDTRISTDRASRPDLGTDPSSGTDPERLRLAPYTTLRVGGPATAVHTLESESALLDALRSADAATAGGAGPARILGGGSNVLIGDAGVDGPVLRVATSGIRADVSGCSGAVVTVAAGENWDAFVARAVEQGWGGGIECLAGIPGLVGATPIQNVGAYGVEVGQLIASVRTWDRHADRQVSFAAADCGFAFRSSRFKTEPNRYLVIEVTFQFPLGSLSAPIRYPELARTLGVELGERVPADQARAAVLQLRRSKGMVLDEADYDTWSAGSFFLNPILEPERAATLPAEAPRFATEDGRVKSSAGWLIEQAGFAKGYGTPPATLSTKHALALTNRGGARTDDLLRLAREIRAGVHDRFGITLVPEPTLWGCAL
jgi:UDP-N-acetylmuramate dehydrogenase